MKKKTKQQILSLLLSGKAAKRYQGKQVVVFDGRVYILPENDQEAGIFVNRLMERNPGIKPTLAFVPRAETYILII